MELLCPLCQKRLMIGDEYAGQLLKCTFCAGMFQAPALPGAPASSSPPPPAYTSQPAPQLTLDGYRRVRTLHLRQSIVALIPLISLLLILAASFLSWTTMPPEPAKAARGDADKTDTAKSDTPKRSEDALGNAVWSEFNLWQTAYSSTFPSKGIFLTYTIFYFVMVLLAIFVLLIDRNVGGLGESLKGVAPWRSLLVAVPALFGFLFLFVEWIMNLFTAPDPDMIGFKLGLRLQLLVMVAAFVDFWLQGRKDLPVPKIEIRC